MKRHFFNFHSIICKATDEGQMVKGFVSMNNADRSEDFISPEAFLLDRFMVNPQLMYNHKKWLDKQGNEHNIGLVREARVAIVKDIGDEKYWGIADEEGKQFETFSKERAPDLVPGSRGLWVKAEVTIDEVWKMVENGELNTFSWKGVATFAKAIIGGIEKIVTKAIDLWECSLVIIPDNFASTFEIAKGIGFGTDLLIHKRQGTMDTLVVHKVLFSEGVFDETQAHEWLVMHGLEVTEMKSVNGELESVQEIAESFEEDFLSVQLATGVQVLVGKEKIDDKTKALETTTIDSLTKALNGDTVSLEKEAGGVSHSSAQALPSALGPEVSMQISDLLGKREKGEVEDKEFIKEAEVMLKKIFGKSAPEDSNATDTPSTEETVDKGVQDQLDRINDDKWVKLSGVFKTISAFEETVYETPNESKELKDVVGELIKLLGSEKAQIKEAGDAGEGTPGTPAENKKSEAPADDGKVEKQTETEGEPGKKVEPSTEAKKEDETPAETQKKDADEVPADEKKEDKADDDKEEVPADKADEEKSAKADDEKVPEKPETEKKAPEETPITKKEFSEFSKNITDALKTLGDGVKANAETMQTLTKSVFEEDGEEVEKNAGDADPNNVFGSKDWPFKA